MVRFLIQIAVNGAALWVADYALTGIQIRNQPTGLIVAALLFSAVTVFIKPIVMFLALPFRLLTLGLATWVINAALFGLTAALTSYMSVNGIGAALLGALIVGLVSMVAGWVTNDVGSPSRAS